MIPHNKDLMFSGRALHPGVIPWTAFLSYPNSNAPLHHLTCSLSQPPLLEQPKCCSPAGQEQMSLASHPHQQMGLGKPWWDQPWPACAHQRVPATLLLAMDLIGTHQITLKLQPRRHWKHPQHSVLYTLSTLFLNTCKKNPLLHLSRKKNPLLPLASVSTLLPHFSLPCGGNCCCYWDAQDYATV